MAINQQGDIVGFGATDESDLNGDFLRAFIWTRSGGMKQIDPLPGVNHVLSQATGINEQGQVVGSSCTLAGACLDFCGRTGPSGISRISSLTLPASSLTPRI